MDADPRTAWLEGRLVPWAEARLPLEDRAVQFSESLYEVVAVTAGRPRGVAEHTARMKRAASVLGLGDGVPGARAWERIVAELIRSEQVEEGLLYAQVTGGSAPRRFLPARAPRARFFAYLRRHRFPRREETARGIRAISLPDPRWDRSDLKTTMLLPAVLAKREAARRGAAEAILLGPAERVREGASSTVFIVEGRRILSPEPTPHTLPGTTAPLVARLAREAGLEAADSTITLPRLLAANEVFVTATSLLVMPLAEVDGKAIGEGRGGPVALDLAARLRAWYEI